MNLRRALIILVTTIITNHSFAQDQEKAPPFRQMLANAGTDSQKLTIYKQINEFYREINTDSMKFYMEEGIRIFSRHNFKPGLAMLHGTMASQYAQLGQMDMAQRSGEEALKLNIELSNQLGVARAHNSLGVLEGQKGNYDAAVKHFIEALKYFDKANDTANIINTYIKLGTANDFAGNGKRALEYYFKGLNYSLAYKLTANRAYLYNNIGSYYGKNYQYDKAMLYLNKALEASTGTQFVHAHVSSLHNIGMLYAEMHDKAKAQQYYRQALDLSRSSGVRIQEAKILHSMGILEGYEDHDTRKLEQAYLMAREMGNMEAQINILADLAKIADTMGNFKDEVAYLRKGEELRDSIYNINKAREIAKLQSEYELGKTNTQLSALQAAELRNKEKKDLIIIIAVVLAITLVTLLFFFFKGRMLNMQLTRREQELQKANDIKDRLFSIVGHDLRGPIGNIPVLLSIYRSEDTPPAEKEYILNSLEENSVASMETLEKLLNWGKLQIKGVTINKASFEVADILDNKLKLFRVQAGNKNINIINKVPATVSLYADENHFKFVVRNLLANAIKYTREGGVIEINAENKDDRYMVFSVKDNGIGIDEERQRHIFEPYNDSTVGTANEIGNSIGLMLCREFILQNGGDIWVKSEKGTGTTFYFTIMGSYQLSNN